MTYRRPGPADGFTTYERLGALVAACVVLAIGFAFTVAFLVGAPS